MVPMSIQMAAFHRIPWMKTEPEWTSSLSNFGQLLSGAGKAKSSSNGADYEDYIQKLLYLESDRELNYRTMDLMEQQMRTLPDSQMFQMDQMIISMKVSFTYEAKPLFSKLATIGKASGHAYEMKKTEKYSYLPQLKNDAKE